MLKLLLVHRRWHSGNLCLMWRRVGHLAELLHWALPKYGPANYATMNPIPQNVLYTTCSHVCDTCMSCMNSLEFGPRCGHSSRGEPKYRFHMVLFNAIHAGTPPLKAQIWDCVAILLNSVAVDFNQLDAMSQLSTL